MASKVPTYWLLTAYDGKATYGSASIVTTSVARVRQYALELARETGVPVLAYKQGGTRLSFKVQPPKGSGAPRQRDYRVNSSAADHQERLLRATDRLERFVKAMKARPSAANLARMARYYGALHTEGRALGKWPTRASRVSAEAARLELEYANVGADTPLKRSGSGRVPKKNPVPVAALAMRYGPMAVEVARKYGPRALRAGKAGLAAWRAVPNSASRARSSTPVTWIIKLAGPNTLSVRRQDRTRVFYATLYPTGEVGWDFPEQIPEYVKKSVRQQALHRIGKNPGSIRRVYREGGPGDQSALVAARGDGYVATIGNATVTFKKHPDGWRWTLRGKAAKRPGNSPRGRGRWPTLTAAVRDAFNILGR